MSQILEELPPKGRGGRKLGDSKYPMAEWADGQPRLLTRGEDFECQVSSVLASLSRYCRQKNMKLYSRRVSEDSFAVQAVIRKPELTEPLA